MRIGRAILAGVVAIFAASCDDSYYVRVENVSGQPVVLRSEGRAFLVLSSSSSEKLVYSDLYRPLEIEAGGCIYPVPAPWQDWKAYAERYGINRAPRVVRIEPNLSLVFFLPRVPARSPLAGEPIVQVDSFTLKPEPASCQASPATS